MIDAVKEFGKWFFYIHSHPEKSEISRYESLKQVEKSIGKTPIELAVMPDMPSECAAIWGSFVRLSDCSYTEIQAYGELTGCRLQPWEVEAVIQLAKIRSNPPKDISWLLK